MSMNIKFALRIQPICLALAPKEAAMFINEIEPWRFLTLVLLVAYLAKWPK